MARLALYKAPGDLYDRATRACTRSPFSHCELVLPDGRTLNSRTITALAIWQRLSAGGYSRATEKLHLSVWL